MRGRSVIDICEFYMVVWAVDYRLNGLGVDRMGWKLCQRGKILKMAKQRATLFKQTG